jgi:hypothetical protein
VKRYAATEGEAIKVNGTAGGSGGSTNNKNGKTHDNLARQQSDVSELSQTSDIEPMDDDDLAAMNSDEEVKESV